VVSAFEQHAGRTASSLRYVVDAQTPTTHMRLHESYGTASRANTSAHHHAPLETERGMLGVLQADLLVRAVT
jgi:hypothetical protein